VRWLVEGGENLFGRNQTAALYIDDGCHVRVGAIRTLLLAKALGPRTFPLDNTCSARPHRTPHIRFA
jgi:hypothetical protein